MNDNERWHTVRQGDTSVILHGNRLVGSIVRDRGLVWRVEILWSGPTGDIKGEFNDYAQALAFVEGVEQTLMALGLYHPELNLGTKNDDQPSRPLPAPPHIR